jgi:hypothetical protein
VLSKGSDEIVSANLINGAAKLSISKDKAVAGTYFLIVYDGDDFVASKDIVVSALPANVWTVTVDTESNMVQAHFNVPIALNAAKFDVKLAGKSVGGTLQSDGRTIIFDDANASDYVSGAQVVITGVKLPGLFPDYVFTYKSALTKKYTQR